MTNSHSPRRIEAAAGGLTITAALVSGAARLGHLPDTPRLDAEVLLMHILGKDRAYLRAWPERVLSPDQAERYRQLIERRAEGRPVAYLTGQREFWSRLFTVRPGVLIPRPETELLIELALAALPADRAADLLDLGTGSGIVAVTLAAERPRATVTATDLSPDALAVARENAARHGLTNIRFAQGDWFAALPENERFDLIASNPPYIAERDPHLSLGDVRFEPTLALASGPEGLDALAAIATGARKRLKPGGRLLLEHGYDQAEPIALLLAGLGYAEIAHHPDLQGHLRATSARWP
jgi:release factor glutamine methyltransferase